jgi:hypothetical protein
MMTRPALDDLDLFNNNPTFHNASRLVNIPALYNILSHKETHNRSYSKMLLSVCKWLWERGRTVLEKLIIHPAPPMDQVVQEQDSDWQKVNIIVINNRGANILQSGCCYSMPQVRYRPEYPHLKHDLRNDPGGQRGAKCSKYYLQYGEQRLTGGIMCVWCTHSICYG